MGPNSKFSQQVLKVLEEKGFGYAPRFLGIDEKGREILSKEFAERLAASPGGRDYGSISIAVQLYADVELGPIVPGDSFHPPTKVESQVMKLTFLSQPRIVIDDLKHFEWVVRAAFSQRRKKLINSLMSRGKWSKEVIMVALEQAEISPGIRAEQIAIGQFAALAEALPR